jgi:hypothetical protein
VFLSGHQFKAGSIKTLLKAWLYECKRIHTPMLIQESGSFRTTQQSKKSDFLKKSDFYRGSEKDFGLKT